MADDDQNSGFKPDVPAGPGTSLVVSTPAEKRAYLARLSGELPPNECRYLCRNCGQDKTLQFADDEMDLLASMSQTILDYSGPCWNCNTQMLVPYDTIQDGSFKSIQDMAKDNKKRDYTEASEVFLDKLQSRVGDMLTGGMPGAAPVQTDGATAPGKPSSRDNFPDAADVDLSDLKPRKG
jgi:hypothetical protein